MDEYDVYLVHAGEDSRPAGVIVKQLREQGLAVWFNSFTPGLRIRPQMEDGLRRSSFGVVLVTNTLFTKKWALEELDALFGLEDETGTKIIPVWLDISREEVLRASPMLASRSAIVAEGSSDAELRTVAGDVTQAILRMTIFRSPAQWLRSQVAAGLSWAAPPAFFRNSLEFLDQSEQPGYWLAQFARYPNGMHHVGGTKPCSLEELIENPTNLAGTEITTIGHQSRGSLQVIETHDQEIGEHNGGALKRASWVFQMHSWTVDRPHTVYVHFYGPVARDIRPDLPSEWLVWVTGIPIAYGNVRTLQGRVAHCIYLAGRGIFGSPPVDVGS